MSLYHPAAGWPQVDGFRPFVYLRQVTVHTVTLCHSIWCQYYQAGTSLQSDVMIHIQMDHQEAMTCAAGHGRWLLLGLSPKLPRSGSVQALHSKRAQIHLLCGKAHAVVS
jgi:hypothetical protein